MAGLFDDNYEDQSMVNGDKPMCGVQSWKMLRVVEKAVSHGDEAWRRRITVTSVTLTPESGVRTAPKKWDRPLAWLTCLWLLRQSESSLIISQKIETFNEMVSCGRLDYQQLV